MTISSITFAKGTIVPKEWLQAVNDYVVAGATLGTMSTQNASAVAITGGTITGITDLAVADGGTGASTAAGARTALGSTSVGDAVFIAANAAAGRSALSAAASGANSDITSLQSSCTVTTQSASDNSTKIASTAYVDSAVGVVSGIPAGVMQPYGGITTPSGYLLCYGQTVSRTTYATLWAAISATVGTATMTIASPCVVSKTTHGLTAGDRVSFTTSGTLPTGITAGTSYYVIAAGLTADDFEISATQGGSAINTSGSQSGTHTLIHNPWGTPAADTANFLVPDMRGRGFAGKDNMGGSAASRLTSGGSGVYGANVGSVGGTETHTLTTAQLPSHSHTIDMSDGTGGVSTVLQSSVNTAVTSTYTSSSTGSGNAHNNTPPIGVGNWIIKT